MTRVSRADVAAGLAPARRYKRPAGLGMAHTANVLRVVPALNRGVEPENLQTVLSIPEYTKVNCLKRVVYFPIFTLTTSLAQILCFYVFQPSNGYSLALTVPLPPSQLYTIISYMFAHLNNYHLWVNIIGTLTLGVFLELRNGFWRVGFIWLCAGVLSGLTQSIAIDATRDVSSDEPQSLIGSSGAVYGILASYLSDVIVNWSELRFKYLYTVSALFVLVSEILVFALSPQSNVAYVAHISGFAYGFLFGIVAIRNLRWKQHEYYIFIIALSCGVIATIATCIAFSPLIY